MSPDLLALAQEALVRGESNTARKLVAQHLLADPADEQAWLLMARLANNRQQVIQSLEHALRINPNNRATRSALQAMQRGRAIQTKPAAIYMPIPLTPPAKPSAAKSEAAIAVPAPWTIPQMLPEEEAETVRAPRRKLNISLLLGSLIVLLVVLIAIIGPKIAPQDPMEEHSIFQVGDKWEIPPFNALQVPGFILGSDQFGRDMLSRILYAVRPTLIMVSIVAVVRLFLGTIIGLGAGWFSGRLGRLLDGLISAALAVPILLVALGVITMLGTETGLIAFIIGLSINGWGETARLVRQQAELIKGQLFIESARSLGASSFQILFRHILRQIMSMVWMLFAFEISGTLMVTAGLGFLGYYIGGDVWIEVADFVSRRTAGAPELGQMLATSWVNLLQPWPLVLTGSVVFLTILGFNLLGEGLRSRLSPEFINRTSLVARLSRRFSLWFEESVSYPVSSWLGVNRLRPALVGVAVVLVGSSVWMYQSFVANRFNPSQAALTIPGGQIWASDRVDPYGTFYFNAIGPARPNKLWQMNDFAGLTGNPVVSSDGTVYVTGLDAKLISVNPDGTIRWQIDTPDIPSGTPALAANNTIYVTDVKGDLTAFDPNGTQLWTYINNAFGSPKHGAIVAPDGTIYYLLEDARWDTLIALSPSGQLLWSIKPGTHAADSALRLSPDGKQIFVKDQVVNAQDGSLVKLTLPTQNNPLLGNKPTLLVGADGKSYLLAGHVVIRWTQSAQGFSIVQSTTWDYRSAGFSQTSGYPVDAGVTPKGEIWLYYSGSYSLPTIFWLSPNGSVIGSFSATIDPTGILAGIDGKGTAYLCGMRYISNQPPATACLAYRQTGEQIEWTYYFPEGVYGVVGAALAPGRLYVITPDGNLTALGDSDSSPSAPTSTP